MQGRLILAGATAALFVSIVTGCSDSGGDGTESSTSVVTRVVTEVASQPATTTTTAATPAPLAPTTTETPAYTPPPEPPYTPPAVVEPDAPSIYYASCAAVRAAGAAPIHRGDPGYSSDLDRDGDGVACES